MTSSAGAAASYVATKSNLFDVAFSSITDQLGGKGVRVTYRGLLGVINSGGGSIASVLVKLANGGATDVVYFNPGAQSEFVEILTSISANFRRFRLSGPSIGLEYTPFHGVSDSSTVEHGGVMVAYVSDPGWVQNYSGTTDSAEAWAALAASSNVTEFPTSLPARISLPVPTKGPILYRSIYPGTDPGDLADERLSYAGGLAFAWAGGSPPSTAVEYGDLMITISFDLFEIGLPSGSAVLRRMAAQRAARRAAQPRAPTLGSSAFPNPWPVILAGSSQPLTQPVYVVDITPAERKDDDYFEVKSSGPPPSPAVNAQQQPAAGVQGPPDLRRATTAQAPPVLRGTANNGR